MVTEGVSEYLTQCVTGTVFETSVRCVIVLVTGMREPLTKAVSHKLRVTLLVTAFPCTYLTTLLIRRERRRAGGPETGGRRWLHVHYPAGQPLLEATCIKTQKRLPCPCLPARWVSSLFTVVKLVCFEESCSKLVKRENHLF